MKNQTKHWVAFVVVVVVTMFCATLPSHICVRSIHNGVVSSAPFVRDWKNPCVSVLDCGKGVYCLTSYLSPQVFWNATSKGWFDLEFVENPPFASGQNCRYFVRNAHLCLEIYDTYAKLYDPNYTKVAVYSEQLTIEKYTNGWKDTGVGSQVPKWLVAQKTNSVNITRIQSLVGVGRLNVTYVIVKGARLKHEIVYQNLESKTYWYRACFRLAGITATKVTTQDETFTATGEKHKITPFFTIGNDHIVYSEYLWSLGHTADVTWLNDYEQDIVFNTHAQGCKADIYIGNYSLSTNQMLLIDPTTSTFPISTGANDGFVYGRNEAYSTARSTAFSSSVADTGIYIGQSYAFDPVDEVYYYYVYRSFLKFDTSSIGSESTISNAKLRLYGQSDFSIADFTIRLQKWTDDTPINTGDYNCYDDYNYDDGAFSTSSFSISAYNNITINNFALINQVSNSLICVRSSRDISSTTPTGKEYVTVRAYEHASGLYAPLLEVTYTGAGYALNLRVCDWDLVDPISGATVYKDADYKTSDSEGWANWTSVSGTAQVKVSHFGYWVNGTFQVTMDADKTIDIQCNLYDVTITAKPNNDIGVLSGVNVTAYNDTGTASGKIKSGITVDYTGQVTLTNIPNGTNVRFILRVKSDYTIIIANVTKSITSDGQTESVAGTDNYATVTMPWLPIVFCFVSSSWCFKHKNQKNRG